MPRPAMSFIVFSVIVRLGFIIQLHELSWFDVFCSMCRTDLRRLSDSTRCRDLEDSLLSACAGKDLHTRGKTSIDEGRGYTGLKKRCVRKGRPYLEWRSWAIIDIRCPSGSRLRPVEKFLSAGAGKGLYPWHVVKSISQAPIARGNLSRNRWNI